MHFAAEMGHTTIIRMLKDWDADVNKQDNDGRTPMDFAAMMGQANTIHVLYELGAVFK